MFGEITATVNAWGDDWDEVPEESPEQLAEKEFIESLSLYGYKWLLTHKGAEAFSKWWHQRGRHMSRPLDFNIT